jgi:DHA2 family multidrug resistance protein
MTAIVGPILGPVLGGWITDSYSWSWIFYINVPVGLFAASVSWFFFRDRETPAKRSRVDFVGLLSLVAWVGSLQIMLDKGKDLDWFNSPVIIALTICAGISFLFFVIWELTDPQPIIDLRLFKRRNFLGGTLAISVGFALYFGSIVILPQWLQDSLNYRALDAGLALAPSGVFTVLLAPVMGKIMPKVDLRVLVTLAFLGFTAVFFMRSNYTTDVDTWTLVMPTLLLGIPTAFFFVPLTSIILSGLPPERIPAAAGLSNFARVFAGGVGTSLVSTVWNNRTILHHSQLAEQTGATNPAYTGALKLLESTLGVDLPHARAFFEQSLNAQATMLGLNDIFWISAVIFVLIIPLIWITKPGNGSADAAATAGH